MNKQSAMRVLQEQEPLADPVAERLRRIAGFDAPLPYAGRPRELSARTQLLARGQGLATVSVLLAGWAGHVEFLADGRRQIVHLVLPGEVIGYARPGRIIAPATVAALTPVKVCNWRISDDPSLAAAQLGALTASDTIEQCCMANQITRIGRRSAFERMGHLLLEMRERLTLAGMIAGDRFPLPLTQEVLADVLGLTTVHVNRTIQQLRAERHVDIGGGMVELLDPERLMKIADYSPLVPSSLPQV